MVSITGVVLRWFHFAGKTRPDMADDCPERLDWDFLRYVWTFERKMAPRVEQLITRFGRDIPVCQLGSFSEHAKLLTLLRDDV